MPQPESTPTAYVVKSGVVSMNEHQLVRVLERMERRRQRGPALSDCLATLLFCLTIVAVLATANFHEVHGISKDDIHTTAVVMVVLSALLTVVLWVWWLMRLPGNLKVETPEQVVAAVKQAAAEDEQRLRDAEAELATSSQRPSADRSAADLLLRLKRLRLQAEVLRQAIPAFENQTASSGASENLIAWQGEVSTALAQEPALKAQFDSVPDDSPLLSAFKAHPLSIRLQNRLQALDAIIKYVGAGK